MGMVSITIGSRDHHSSKLPSSPFRSFCLPSLGLAAVYFVFLLFLFQIGTFRSPLSSSSFHHALQVQGNTSECATTENQLARSLDMLRDSVTFLPLRDVTFKNPLPIGGNWFMSSVNDTYEKGESEYRYFPSASSKGRLLCLLPYDRTDGSENSYAFAWPEALPRGATLLRGLTYVSDTLFIYDNIWHGITALVPFVSWHQRKGCVPPARWALFHCGALRTVESTSDWVRKLASAATGAEMKVEDFESYKEGPVCFEEAIVYRHNEGKMDKPRRQEVFDMMRCKAREYCKITKKLVDPKVVKMTLLLRQGARSFKNESEVIRIFAKACDKFDGCKFKYGWGDNLTFCEQVKLLTETDLLVSQHGAQMANLVFMDKSSSIMEMYPKGWKEYAGNGQYVFRWMADWTGMKHKGSWWDSIPEGEKCPHSDQLACFYHYKNGHLGYDEAFFSDWSAKVLREVRDHKSSQPQPSVSAPCPCS